MPKRPLEGRVRRRRRRRRRKQKPWISLSTLSPLLSSPLLSIDRSIDGSSRFGSMNGWMDGSMQVNMTDSSQNGLDWMDGVPLSSLLLEMAGVQRDREGGTSRGVSLFLSFLYLVRHNIIIHYVSL